MQLLNATEVAAICKAAQKPYAPATCEGIQSHTWDEFVWMIDRAMEGRVIHAPAACGQLQHFICIGHLTDGQPLFEHA